MQQCFLLFSPEKNEVFLDGQIRWRGRTGDGGDSSEGEGTWPCVAWIRDVFVRGVP